ncbi:MAG: hypothetical protein AAGG59_03710 [Bacteroidota bacterium]
MKNIQIDSLKTIAICALLAVSSGCDRSVSDDVEFATFSKEGEIFDDNFVSMGTDFYFPFIGDGAKADVFSIDESEGFESDASIRIDVPNADDPDGNFAGASFIIDGPGRNLTGFDALTFWAKSTQAATIGSLSFGKEFRAVASDVDFTTQWQKYTIPIPDPSKLLRVRTVFEFSAGGIIPAGAQAGQGLEVGYTFWIDELKFEKLGTIAQSQPSILDGEDVVTEAFIGQELLLIPLTQTFNLANGTNQTISVATSYFAFSSTDPEVARINEQGVVSILNTGMAEITASIDGVRAEGSLNVSVLGQFDTAPIPPARNAEDVISIFSEAYTSQSGFNAAAFNNPDIQIEESDFDGDAVINYSNLGFVGIGWDEPADVSSLEFLHVDIQVNQSFSASDGLVVEIIDFGANGTDDGPAETRVDDTGGGYRIEGSQLTEGQWVGIDIPVTGFTLGTGGGFNGSPNLTKVARVAFVEGGISNILVDNIYFYR